MTTTLVIPGYDGTGAGIMLVKPGRMTDADARKKYVVSAYENSEISDRRWIDEGGFDSADDAMRCAEAVIDRSLFAFFRPRMSAEHLRMSYLCYGEVPSIFNEQGLKFDAYECVYRRIRELSGESEWNPKE